MDVRTPLIGGANDGVVFFLPLIITGLHASHVMTGVLVSIPISWA